MYGREREGVFPEGFQGEVRVYRCVGHMVRPCCKEIPYLQQLEKKLAKKKIVFVSLSCVRIVLFGKDGEREKDGRGAVVHGGRTGFPEGIRDHSYSSFCPAG